MFKTHYAKQYPRNNAGFILTMQESLMYVVAQDDVLYTADALFRLYLKQVISQLDEPKAFSTSSKSMHDTLGKLIVQGYFKEIHSERIDRMLSLF